MLQFRTTTTASTASRAWTSRSPTRWCSMSSALATSAVKEQRATFNGSTDEFAPILTGCWQFAGGHGREALEDVASKLNAHADAGFDTFDTADIYGPSEAILGQFQAARKAEGKAPVKIFTKYVPNIFQQKLSPTVIESAIQRSLKNLQSDSLELVQLHWWDYDIPGMVDTAKSLAELQQRGVIKHVGLTNMNCMAVQQILDAGVKVACNQVQFSLLDRRPLNGMLQLCEANGIKLFAYGSVGGGLLSDKYLAPPEKGLFGAKYPSVDLNTSSLKMYWNQVRAFGGQALWQELLEALKSVADKHDVSVANVSVKWIMQQGNGNTVHTIIGMRGAAHLEDNARVLNLKLDSEDMARIDSVLAKGKGPSGDIYSFERA